MFLGANQDAITSEENLQHAEKWDLTGCRIGLTQYFYYGNHRH
ncbi:MAG: hypothetical protein DVB28_000449 [Verrucomicrobia bacterium]|nr:MAG: hypothetical protein DVB28_000449 [Verrucomicrobiota bacterium]